MVISPVDRFVVWSTDETRKSFLVKARLSRAVPAKISTTSRSFQAVLSAMFANILQFETELEFGAVSCGFGLSPEASTFVSRFRSSSQLVPR